MPLWRWAALLSFALVAPAALPAGGAERRVPEVRRREQPGEPLTASATTALRCEPSQQAPAIAEVAIGEPLRVVHSWSGCGGERWLRVELLANRRRGWMPG